MTMGGEAEVRSGLLFLDTSVLVAATVEVHPSHVASRRYIDQAVASDTVLHISTQVCREFLVVLTRQPVSGRAFSLDEALVALDRWTLGCVVLPDSEEVLSECLILVRRFGVHGKQVHDCNIVATMISCGVERLGTRNAADFRRFGRMIRIESVEG